MRVWIDQDGCTGAGLCVDHCPDLFVVLEDGIGYVHDHHVVIERPGVSLAVPNRYERDVIDAVERCPGECIHVEGDAPTPRDTAVDSRVDSDDDIVDAEVVELG